MKIFEGYEAISLEVDALPPNLHRIFINLGFLASSDFVSLRRKRRSKATETLLMLCFSSSMAPISAHGHRAADSQVLWLTDLAVLWHLKLFSIELS